MITTGKFITIEGQDGAGKTTSVRFVERLIRDSNIELHVTREPGGTRLGEELRRIILDGHEFHIDAMAELLMMFAARAQHLSESIQPALSRGAWVLCDRFTDATFAYQSGGRGLPWANVESLQTLVQGCLRPDLTLPKLAQKVGCSGNHLSQVINSEFGTSFFEYLNQYRIDYAKELLSRNNGHSSSILNIAFTVGFNSNSAFYSAFKKRVGITPAQYRQRQLNRRH